MIIARIPLNAGVGDPVRVHAFVYLTTFACLSSREWLCAASNGDSENGIKMSMQGDKSIPSLETESGRHPKKFDLNDMGPYPQGRQRQNLT